VTIFAGSKVKAAWRYLRWLSYERDQLAEELGAHSRIGIYEVEDRIVNLFFRPWFNSDPQRERAGDRAERVLARAGISVDLDPHWVGHIR
jgi:hypothetical protein